MKLAYLGGGMRRSYKESNDFRITLSVRGYKRTCKIHDSGCRLCNAIDNEKIIHRVEDLAVIKSKYSVLPDTEVLLPISHHNATDYSILFKCISDDYFTGKLIMRNAEGRRSIPNHTHLHLVSQEYISGSFHHLIKNIGDSNETILLDYYVPLIVLPINSSQGKKSFLSILPYLKRNNIGVNIVIHRWTAYLHLLRPKRYKSIGVYELLGAFSTFSEEKFEYCVDYGLKRLLIDETFDYIVYEKVINSTRTKSPTL